MLVRIEYETTSTKVRRARTFIRESIEEAVKFFNWRYGHKIVSVTSK